MIGNGDEKRLYFINYANKLPPYVLKISEYFKMHGWLVIPVSPVTFADLANNKTKFCLSIITNTLEFQKFLLAQKKFFSYQIMKKAVCYFDITSFGAREQFLIASKIRHYYHLPLPLEINDFCASILKNLNERTSINNVWPGGRRAKLPNDADKSE